MIHKGENWTLKRVLHILQGNKNKQLLGSPPSLISVQWGLLSSWKRSILKLSSFLTRVHIRPYSVHPIADQKIMDTSHHQRGLHEEEYRLHLLLQWRHTWWRRRIWIRRHQRPVHQMERDASRKQSGRKLFRCLFLWLLFHRTLHNLSPSTWDDLFKLDLKTWVTLTT